MSDHRVDTWPPTGTMHDPFCDKIIRDRRWTCSCTLIARVRDDEHVRLITHGAKTNLAGYSEGYAAALDAAREAVRALPDWKFCDAVCGTERSVLAAIDALRPVTCTRCKDTGWTGRADDPDSCDCGRNQ